MTEINDRLVDTKEADSDDSTIDEFRAKPHIPRDRQKVDSELAGIFNDLLNGRKDWPLYLHGEVGTGKTCAGLCLVDMLREQELRRRAANANGNPMARYITVSELKKGLVERDSFLWSHLAIAPLVVVDEIGRHEASSGTPAANLAYDTVAEISDIREHLPTVWISNHEPKKMYDLYDDRIADRLGCGTTHELEGPSRRQGFRRKVR